MTACERGGPVGVQAGRDLDAVTALFDATDRYLSCTAGASLPGLIDHLSAQQLSAAGADPTVTSERGETPLSRAKQYQCAECVTLLEAAVKARLQEVAQ